MKKIKVILFSCVLLMLCGASAFAADDTGTWEYSAYGSGVELTAYNGTQTDVYVPGSIEVSGEKLSVVKLGDNLFSEKDGLNSVTIGEGITEIGAGTFSNSTNLVCIVTPESLTTIGEGAFSRCASFNSIILLDSVTSIGENAFKDCGKLTIYCNEGNNAYLYAVNNTISYALISEDAEPEIYTIDDIEYYVQNGEAIAIACNDDTIKEVILPATVKGYPLTTLRDTFGGCRSLNKVKLPDSVKIIEDGAFWFCNALSDINLPKELSIIGGSAFMHCWDLDITIPENVKLIGAYAFYACNELSSIVIPDTVVEIGENAFEGCSKVQSLIIPQNVTTIGKSAFENCEELESITIENGVTTIGSFAFAGCLKLTDVTISESVKTLGGYAFYQCENLTEIILPGSLTEIVQYTFRDCIKLEKVTISEGTTTIDSYAFNNCDSLTTVKVPSSVTTMSNNSFPQTTIICVDANSYAHLFAEENELVYFINADNSQPETYVFEGVTYYILNGEAIAIDFDGSATNVNIPEKVENYPVVDVLNVFSESKIEKVVLPGSIKKLKTSAFDGCKNLTSVEIPEGLVEIGNSAFYRCSALKSIVIPEGVVLIGESAFLNCTGLESINIPGGITKIENSAFSNCSSLKEISIPEGVTSVEMNAFSGCTALQGVTISSSVTRIKDKAFKGCTSLTDVVLKDGLKSIGYSAFSGCSSLISISVPGSVTYISANGAFPDKTIIIVEENSYAHNYAIDNGLLYFVTVNGSMPEIFVVNGVSYFIENNEAIAISFDDSVAEISIPGTVGGYPTTEIRAAFEGSSITSVSLSEGIKNIGEKAFYECTKLKKVEIPESVTEIGAWAFADCTVLENIILPYGLEKIGHSAFLNCDSLSEVTLPDSVTSVSAQTFWGCDSLRSTVLSKGMTSIPGSMFVYCYNLQNVEIPEGITEIGSQAFFRCYKLNEIVLPDGLTSIQFDAFGDCTSLSNILIPEGVSSIKSGAFESCSNLTTVIIPDSVQTIQSTAFTGCNNLRVLKIPSTLTTIGNSAFSTTTILCVEENSYAHTFAVENNLLYFVLQKVENPEISYGSGISGTVTYTDGTAASGATVEILYDDGTVKETVTTDETGAYSFTYAEVGRYTIRVKDASGNTGSETVLVKRMNVFDVFLAGETNITLKKGYTISGSISPAGSATITLTDTDGNVVSGVEIADGSFSIANVPNGTYILKAETENGTAVQEITVFNSDVGGVTLSVEAEGAIITGYVEVEDRGKNHHRRNWVHVTVYNSEGVAVASQKTDADGKYIFENLPLGEYSIVAETTEMRPDKHKHFDRSHTLTGYAYVNAAEATTYEVETIILYEENDHLATISGKVTANGEHQACEVIFTNVFRHEVAKCTTGKNGKYTFTNIRDGLYFVTAVTESDGMGFAVVVVRDGKVYGNTDIKVSKAQKIHDREKHMKDNIPHCESREDAIKHRDKIAEEKRYYDGLPEKEKKQFSKEYIERLNKLCEWIADCTNTGNGGKLENGGMILSEEELKSEDTFEIVLDITESSETQIGEDGINTRDQYVQQSINDTAGDKTLAKYYDISLTKKDSKGNAHKITSVSKDTDTTGKVRITMDIPEEYRGHKHYHFVHMHNGVPTTLTDLDDDPNTITFEVDRFSTFALTYTDEELAVDGELEEEEETEEADNFGTRNACIRAMLNENTKCRVTLLSGIDSLKYKSVGFEVTVGETTRQFDTKTVYTSVSALSAEKTRVSVAPSDFGGNSQYIFGVALSFGEAFKEETLIYRPYAVDFAGNYIYGKESTISPIFKQ